MFEKSLKSILPDLECLADSKTVLGKPVTVGPITLVPVISLNVGLGSGYSESLKTGGGGGGINVDPCAVIVINESKVSVYPLRAQDGIAGEPAELWEQEP